MDTSKLIGCWSRLSSAAARHVYSRERLFNIRRYVNAHSCISSSTLSSLSCNGLLHYRGSRAGRFKQRPITTSCRPVYESHSTLAQRPREILDIHNINASHTSLGSTKIKFTSPRIPSGFTIPPSV